jgi:hypothetical protein
MSVLSLPRINFLGACDWNPNTVNNSPTVYDESTAEPVKQKGIPFDGFVRWLIKFNEPTKAPNGSWNVYGDHSATFVNATIKTCQPSAAVDDPLIGKSIQILGDMRGKSSTPARLVDVDPYGSTTSQIFYDTFSVGDRTLGFSAHAACRMFSRWPNFQRNLQRLPIAGAMGVIWHTAAKSSDVEWCGVGQSPTLQALREAANASGNQGLVMIFAAYRTLYFQKSSWQGKPIKNGKDLSEAYQAGFTDGNPAESVIVGSIGVWENGELASAPIARVLAPGAPVLPSRPVMHAMRAVQELASQEVAPAQKPVTLGPALAEIDTQRQVVTLDLIATFPEQNSTLAKADLGTFQLQVRSTDGTVTKIGAPLTPTDYGQTTYEATAGLVEVPFTPGQLQALQTGSLEIVQQGKESILALAEQPLLAETDQRGVYVDQSQTQSISINIYQKGQLAGGSTEIQILIAQYDNTGTLIATDKDRFVEVLNQQGKPLTGGVASVENGTASIKVRALHPGTCFLGFFPFQGQQPPQAPSNNFPGTADFYAVIRTLPFDNKFKNLPPDQVVDWNFVYQNVLLNFDVVYPVMSLIINLHDQKAFDSSAPAIEHAISPSQFESTLAMPITREMSAGKRALLLKYLQNIGKTPSPTR